jgi:hypothetical protein
LQAHIGARQAWEALLDPLCALYGDGLDLFLRLAKDDAAEVEL